ncbi:MAG TPA: Mut7-C RNAse domain-containing protein [Chloroflexota bacterium]|nr:Mut7-C RNAse domain-containing protein [Chloroflexota bacterium]
MKFIADNNVGKLAVWLRALGYDTLFINPIDDARLIEIARREDRVILTRDTGIMRRRVITSGEVRALLIEGDSWRNQLIQVVHGLGMEYQPRFTRCLECNTPLETRSRDDARRHVPPFVYRTQHSFLACPGCGRYYWQGTHWQRMRRELTSVLTVSREQVMNVVAMMRDFPALWFVVGGWALDLLAGTVSREHTDLELGIARDDQHLLPAHFPEWRRFKAMKGPHGGVWQPWPEGERLELPVHQVLLRQEGADPPEFQFFLNEIAGGEWRFRHIQTIRRPVDRLIVHTRDGVPVIAPEIQLRYKARDPRPKDEADFRLALPLLDHEQRRWLRESLQVNRPDHPWIPLLDDR